MPFLATTDKTELFYNDWGTGTPIVLIHGWPVTSAMWEYQAAPLVEAGFRVIAYDRRGFGKSSQPYAGYDYDTLADDLSAVLEHLDLDGAVLVGFSMGGGEVARYMSRHAGKRVAKAALVAAVTPYLLKTADNPDGVDASVFEGILDGLREDRPHFLAGFAKMFFNAGLLNFDVSAEILQQFVAQALEASPKATLDCIAAFGRTDFRDDLTKVDVPTLVIHGDSDAIVPFEVSGRRSAEAIAGSTLVVVEGAPHGFNVSHAERFNDELIRFLQG